MQFHWSQALKATSFSLLIFAAAVYGFIVQQVGRYGSKYKADSRTLKLWVYLLWFLTTLGLALDSYNVWQYLTLTDKYSIAVTLPLQGLISGFTIFLVHIFFIVRIWSVRKEVWPTSSFTIPACAGLVLVALSTLACNSAGNILLAIPDHPANVRNTYETAILTRFYRYNIATDAVLDLIITSMLVYILRVHQNEFSHLQKESSLQHLLVFFAVRGLVISLFALVFFILIFTTDAATVGTAATTLMPKIYAVSMLLTLTNRKRRGGFGASASTGSSMSHPSEPVELVVVSFNETGQYENDVERGLQPRGGRTSPVVFASSKGPPDEVTMEPDPELDDWEHPR